MAASKSTQAEVEYRVNRFVRIVSNGGRRSDCIRFAAENWGVSERTVDTYLKKAREIANKSIESLNWNNGFYRKDIGFKIIDK